MKTVIDNSEGATPSEVVSGTITFKDLKEEELSFLLCIR
jgi:hypothetical protein